MSVTIKTAHEIELMREAGRLLNIVHKELEAAIRPGISTWELDKLGERVIRSFGCVPNFLNYNGNRGLRIVKGMTFAIEPMINAGRADVEWLDDDWTVVTEDGSLAAHYENTILITDGEPEILTLAE